MPVLKQLHQRVYQWFCHQQQRLHPAYNRLRRDPFTRLLSFEEIPIAAALGVHIDVNQATVDDWLRLPSFSIHQARTLASLSQSGVAFYCLEDIAAALAIPVHRLLPMRPLLRFYYYDAGSTEALKVSIHQATLPQLLTLPSMSRPLAERLLAEHRRSPFIHWADVQSRLQLSPEQTAQWLHHLRL